MSGRSIGQAPASARPYSVANRSTSSRRHRRCPPDVTSAGGKMPSSAQRRTVRMSTSTTAAAWPADNGPRVAPVARGEVRGTRRRWHLRTAELDAEPLDVGCAIAPVTTGGLRGAHDRATVSPLGDGLAERTTPPAEGRRRDRFAGARVSALWPQQLALVLPVPVHLPDGNDEAGHAPPAVRVAPVGSEPAVVPGAVVEHLDAPVLAAVERGSPFAMSRRSGPRCRGGRPAPRGPGGSRPRA